MKRMFTFTVCALVLISSISFADPAFITTDFAFTGSGTAQQVVHNDSGPFKGLVTVTVTNTGTQDWGDFHFEIFQSSAETVENVHFLDASMQAYDSAFGSDPTYTVGGVGRTLSPAWDIDNTSIGAKMDLYFYDDPIKPGETATLVVMTDNTQDEVSFFGLMLYPTPVPEPMTLGLLALGGLMLRRRK